MTYSVPSYGFHRYPSIDLLLHTTALEGHFDITTALKMDAVNFVKVPEVEFDRTMTVTVLYRHIFLQNKNQALYSIIFRLNLHFFKPTLKVKALNSASLK